MTDCSNCGATADEEYGCDFCGKIFCDNCNTNVIPWSCDTCCQQYCIFTDNSCYESRQYPCKESQLSGYDFCSDCNRIILPRAERLFSGTKLSLDAIILKVDCKALSKIDNADLDYFDSDFMTEVVKHDNAIKFLQVMSDRWVLPEKVWYRILKHACKLTSFSVVNWLLESQLIDPSYNNCKILKKFNLRLLHEYCDCYLHDSFYRKMALKEGQVLMLLLDDERIRSKLTDEEWKKYPPRNHFLSD